MMQEAKTKRWRGLLADERKSTRRAIIAVLCVSVVAMAAGPLGFWPAFDTHVLILIAPIALTALLLGKWQGCAIGALTGLAEMVHATFQPYDYYEKYFSLPLNSIVLLALFGCSWGRCSPWLAERLANRIRPMARLLRITWRVSARSWRPPQLALCSSRHSC